MWTRNSWHFLNELYYVKSRLQNSGMPLFWSFLLDELILEYGGDIMKQEFRRKEFIQMKATKKMMKSITWRVIFK